MSRSYKKHPSAVDKKQKWAKKAANRKIRRVMKDPDIHIPNREFKKYYQTWYISDYFWIAPSFESFYQKEINRWEEYQRHGWGYYIYLGGKKRNYDDAPPTRGELKQLYDKWYRRK